MISGSILFALLLVLFIVVAGIYNGPVLLRNQIWNARAQIDVQLKRRHNLIPNLIETVTGFTAHEKETIDTITKAGSLAERNVPKAGF